MVQKNKSKQAKIKFFIIPRLFKDASHVAHLYNMYIQTFFNVYQEKCNKKINFVEIILDFLNFCQFVA